MSDRFYIAKALDIIQLEKIVNIVMKDGYKPIGSIFYDLKTNLFCIPMIKE